MPSVSDSSKSPQSLPYQVTLADGTQPFALRKRDMLRLLPSPRLVQRLLATCSAADPEARWLTLARPGRPGCELLVTASSFARACQRLEKGEQPPLLPCEKRRNRGAFQQLHLPEN